MQGETAPANCPLTAGRSGSFRRTVQKPCLIEAPNNAAVFRLSFRRSAGGIAPIHILLLVAFLEVAINRVAVPMLRPLKGLPPRWHTVLDYGGVIRFYL